MRGVENPAPSLPWRWPGGLLGADDPEPVGHLRPDAPSSFLLICDHGGNLVPRGLADLGLERQDLARHIAWDIGALDVGERLSEVLGAELIFQRYSRLVIDCNRPPHEAEAFVERSDGTPIPGNAVLAPQDAARRVAEVFHPYHARIEAAIERRLAAGRPPVIVSIHSFTPRHGERPAPRPWPVSLLFNRDPSFARALERAFARAGDTMVGMNEPYHVDDRGDYAIPYHAERRGLPHVLLELRQDLVATRHDAQAWADRVGAALDLALVGFRSREGAA